MMIHTYVYLPAAETQLICTATLEEAVDQWKTQGAAIWLDFEACTKDEIEGVSPAFFLAREVIDDCFEGEQRSRVDDYEQYLFLLLYASTGMSDPPVFTPRKVAFLLGKRFLITVHDKPVRAIKNLHEKLQQGASVLLRRGVDFLAYCLIDGMVDNSVFCAEHYEDILDELEDKCLLGEVDSVVLNQLSELRGDMNRFRRNMVSMREVLMAVAYGANEEIAKDLEPRFRHIVDHVTLALEIVEATRDVMQSVRDTYHSQLGEKTNTLMRMLTLFTAIMMPMTLITGVYGMNVKLPNMESEVAFWEVVGIMGVVALIMYVYFRIREWL